nr:EpsG family protein [Moraxella osloensis]
MLPYFAVLVLVIVWIALERKATGRKSFWIPLLFLSLFAGTRSYRVGTDTGGYVSNYTNSLDPNYYQFRDDVEKGYQLFDYLLLHLTHNYAWLLSITALFIVFSYLKFIKKYAQNYLLAVIIYITFGVYSFFFNGLRQGIAMAIMMYAMPALLDNKFWRYLLVCLVASMFHISALFMIPFYFVVNLKIKIRYKVLFVIMGTALAAAPLIQYIAKDNVRYEDYAKGDNFGGLFTLGFYVILALFILAMNAKLKIQDEVFIKLSTLYFSGIALLIPIAFLGTNPSGPQRILNYFTWTMVIILPTIFVKIKGVFIKLLFICLCIVYFYLTTTRFSDLTPYRLNPLFEIF